MCVTVSLFFFFLRALSSIKGYPIKLIQVASCSACVLLQCTAMFRLSREAHFGRVGKEEEEALAAFIWQDAATVVRPSVKMRVNSDALVPFHFYLGILFLLCCFCCVWSHALPQKIGEYSNGEVARGRMLGLNTGNEDADREAGEPKIYILQCC